MLSGAVWRTWLRSRPSQILVRPHSAHRFDRIDASQSALVVVDCQPEGLADIESADKLLFRMNTAVDTVRRHRGHLAFVRLAYDQLDYRSIPSTNTEVSKFARNSRFQNATPGADFHPTLAIDNDDIVVRKTRLGVFSTTNLDERLTNLGITTLILAGIHTSGAVLSTVREAADRDYRLLVLSDCTSDVDPDAHELCLHRVIARQAEIVTTSQLDRSLAGGALRRDTELRVS